MKLKTSPHLDDPQDQCEVFSSLSVERREKFDAHKHEVSDFLISTEVSFQRESSPKKLQQDPGETLVISSKMTDLSENFVGEYLDYVDGDANSNDGDDKKSLKPHAQVHLLSATENCKVTNFAEFLHNHYLSTHA